MSDIVIDLDRPPPPPDRTRRRLRWRPRYLGRRPLLAAATAVLVAFVLGAAAPPPRPRFAPPAHLATGSVENFQLLDDAVVVAAGSQVRSYRLDGRLRWSVPGFSDQRLPQQHSGDVVLITRATFLGQTRALDRATGATRWESDGGAVMATPDVVVLGYGLNSSTPEIGFTELVGVRPADGSQLWRAELTAATGRRVVPVIRADAAIGSPLGGFALVDPDGVAQVLDLTTGRWRRMTGWPSPPESTLDGGEFAVMVGRTGALVVWHSSGAAIHGYAPGADRPTWTARQGEVLGGLCDPWVCLSDDVSTRLVDPDNGAELHRTRWTTVYGHAGNRLLAGGGGVNGGTDGEPDGGRLAVVDLATGRTIRQFGGWRVIWPVTGAWVPLLHRIGILTWEVAALRLADGRAYRLGQFARASDDPCQATATHLACASGRGEVLVWRYGDAR